MSTKRQVKERLEPYLTGEEQPNGDHDAYCPLHEDTMRSMRINFREGVWICFAGCGQGNLRQLWDLMEEHPNGKVHPGELRPERNRAEKVTDGHVRGWHSALLSNPGALATLREIRGLKKRTITEYELGWDESQQAYTIPVRSAEGTLLNVRRYQPGSKKKIWSVDGMGTPRLYPERVLEENDAVLICEGELDALIANQNNIPAVTGTGGANSWKPEWSRRFAGKRVWIVYDADEAGVRGARKVARAIAPYVSELHITSLPLRAKGADVTDCFVTEGWSRKKFLRVVQKHSKQYRLPEREGEREPVEVTVLDSFDAALSGRPLRMMATITGRRNPPYLIPKTAVYECDQDAGKYCTKCPLNGKGKAVVEIRPNDPNVLQFIDANDKKMLGVLHTMAGVQCSKNFSMTIKEQQSVEELFLRPSIEQAGDGSAEDFSVHRKVYSVGRHNTMPNQTVRITGMMAANPKDKRNEFLAWEISTVTSSLDSFRVTPDIIQALKAFQPAEDQRPLEKMVEVAEDLSLNVTKIYGRIDVHVAMDLVYHSLLYFPFSGTDVDRGWLEFLLVGDTRTGKSEIAKKLVRHYQAGKIVDCESVSFAGIVGGLQQLTAGKEWSITWGAIPINDRRLVALDEVSGLTTEQIAQMSSVRSSGVAQITKIQAEMTPARTRLIWMSNPRGGRMADFTFGIHALRPLIGNPEDIARFDFAMSVSSDEVSADTIEQHKDDSGKPMYDSELCHTRVMWAWSRKKEHVVWEEGAEDLCYKAGRRMGELFIEEPPLVQQANARIKIARVAVAMAAATFSTDETGEMLVVTNRHVYDACDFLYRIYRKRGFGYWAASREAIADRDAAERNADEIKQFLVGRPALIKFLKNTHGSFRVIDIEEMLNITRDLATGMVNTLWAAGMVQKVGGSVRIQPVLHELLRDLEE